MFRNRFSIDQKFLQVQSLLVDRRVGYGMKLNFSICISGFRHKISEQNVENSSSGASRQPMNDPITSETFPDGEQVREMSATQYGADPSSELEIPNNFGCQISEQILEFPLNSAPPRRLSQNRRCSPRTNTQSAKQLKLQTQSFPTVPIPLQNSK